MLPIQKSFTFEERSPDLNTKEGTNILSFFWFHKIQNLYSPKAEDTESLFLEGGWEFPILFEGHQEISEPLPF